jgi:hypothetical protein
MDPTGTNSRQLLGGLSKLGWQFEETGTEVRLFPPEALSKRIEIDKVLGSQDDHTDGTDREEPQLGFDLEDQLRDFLATNLESILINGRRLKVFVDPSGRDGVEYTTDVGRIDILAIDENGAFYVFELKRGRGDDQVLGQLARYMGWVRATIGKQAKVYGVIVAKSIGDTLRYAASIVPDVSLFEYRVEFFLQPVESVCTIASSNDWPAETEPGMGA